MVPVAIVVSEYLRLLIFESLIYKVSKIDVSPSQAIYIVRSLEVVITFNSSSRNPIGRDLQGAYEKREKPP